MYHIVTFFFFIILYFSIHPSLTPSGDMIIIIVVVFVVVVVVVVAEGIICGDLHHLWYWPQQHQPSSLALHNDSTAWQGQILGLFHQHQTL
jgi:hypothetical protein